MTRIQEGLSLSQHMERFFVIYSRRKRLRPYFFVQYKGEANDPIQALRGGGEFCIATTFFHNSCPETAAHHRHTFFLKVMSFPLSVALTKNWVLGRWEVSVNVNSTPAKYGLSPNHLSYMSRTLFSFDTWSALPLACSSLGSQKLEITWVWR